MGQETVVCPLLFGVATRRETATHLPFLSLFGLPGCPFG
jgi:hypothetical protein